MSALESLTPPYGFINFDVLDFDPEQPWDNYRALGVALNPLALFNGESTIKLKRAAMAADSLNGFVPLSKQTASASATLDFTSGIDSSYDEYMFKFNNLLASAVAVDLQMEISVDGGSSWLNSYHMWEISSRYHVHGSAVTVADYRNGVLASEPLFTLNHGSALASYAQYINGKLNLYAPANTGTNYDKMADWEILAVNGTPASERSVGCGCCTSSSSAINAVRFSLSSGNFTSGNIVMFGRCNP